MTLETSLDLEDVKAFDYECEEEQENDKKDMGKSLAQDEASDISASGLLGGLGDIGGFIENNSSLLFFFLILVIIFNGSGTFSESNESLLFFFLILVVLYNQFNK